MHRFQIPLLFYLTFVILLCLHPFRFVPGYFECVILSSFVMRRKRLPAPDPTFPGVLCARCPVAYEVHCKPYQSQKQHDAKEAGGYVKCEESKQAKNI